MPPPRRSQNPLLTPLNRILGTEANVRLLRALTHARTPVAAGELARRARLSRTNIYPALAALERTGIVEFVGAGARRQVRFRSKHPLSHALLHLFTAEERRVESLTAELCKTLDEASPRAISLWLEDWGEDGVETNDSAALYVLADPKSLTGILDSVSESIATVERAHGINLEIRGVTRSELESWSRTAKERLKEAILLYGVPPTAFASKEQRLSRGQRLQSHDDHDARARRLAVAIAAKIKSDPGLVRIARQQIKKREKVASAREVRELKEWSRILATMSNARLRQFLVEDGERAKRLRQTLPGIGLLSPAEREAVLASASDLEARAAVLER